MLSDLEMNETSKFPFDRLECIEHCFFSSMNISLGLLEAFKAHSGEVSIFCMSPFSRSESALLSTERICDWKWHASRPNLSKFLNFLGDRRSVIFFSTSFLYIIYMIWISRISFDPWDSRKFFWLTTWGTDGVRSFRHSAGLHARVILDGATRQLSVLVVDLVVPIVLRFFLRLRRKSEWGRWRLVVRGWWDDQRWDLANTRWLNSFEAHKDDNAFLEPSALVVRCALANNLYYTVSCVWVSCLLSCSIIWNSFQEFEITAMSQMMWTAMSSSSFPTEVLPLRGWRWRFCWRVSPWLSGSAIQFFDQHNNRSFLFRIADLVVDVVDVLDVLV